MATIATDATNREKKKGSGNTGSQVPIHILTLLLSVKHLNKELNPIIYKYIRYIEIYLWIVEKKLVRYLDIQTITVIMVV